MKNANFIFESQVTESLFVESTDKRACENRKNSMGKKDNLEKKIQMLEKDGNEMLG